jgi:hypothetical protein
MVRQSLIVTQHDLVIEIFTFLEYSTLVSVFPDNIQLACDAGECANEQDFLDVGPIVS